MSDIPVPNDNFIMFVDGSWTWAKSGQRKALCGTLTPYEILEASILPRTKLAQVASSISVTRIAPLYSMCLWSVMEENKFGKKPEDSLL